MSLLAQPNQAQLWSWERVQPSQTASEWSRAGELLTSASGTARSRRAGESIQSPGFLAAFLGSLPWCHLLLRQLPPGGGKYGTTFLPTLASYRYSNTSGEMVSPQCVQKSCRLGLPLASLSHVTLLEPVREQVESSAWSGLSPAVQRGLP